MAMKKLFIHLTDKTLSESSLGKLLPLVTTPQVSGRDELLLAEGCKYLGAYANYHLVLIDDEFLRSLLEASKQGTKLISKHGLEAFAESKWAQYFDLEDALVSYGPAGAGMSLLSQAQMKPLCLDFELLSYRQRLLRGGRQKEAVARAVLSGLEDDTLVFDATAGLGRESMILAHAGAHVMSFERQVPIWLILQDALERAGKSRFFPFTLPKLCPLGTISDYKSALEAPKESSQVWQELLSSLEGRRPEVIYYDPMFPEREKSAQVKKDMFLFQQVIGSDQDTEQFLALACSLARTRVVVKRPSYAEPVRVDGIERSYFVDGGQCRFDCYQC